MNKGGTYLALGDSITYGLGLTTTQQYATYAAQTAKSLSSNLGQVKYINKAISGWKSQDFLTVPYYWSRVKADLVTIHIGTNDASNSVPVATFQNNLTSVMNLIHTVNPNAEIILCTISNRSDSWSSALPAFRTAIQTVQSATPNSFLCQFETAWATANNATNLQADGLHPNYTGHQSLYNTLWPVVQQTNFYKNFGK